MVSFKITAGEKRWYIVGVYMPPNDQPMVNWVEKYLEHGPAGVEVLMVRDLRACLEQPQD